MRKAIVSGLIAGIIAAVLGVGIFMRSSNNIVFETDEHKTLARQLATAPTVAEPTLTHAQLAVRLGMSEDQATREGKIFQERVTGGFLPKDWARTCAASYSAKLCATLDDYFQKQAKVFALPAKRKRAGVNFDLRKMGAVQKSDYDGLLGRSTDWPLHQLERYADAALKVQECPHNFSLILAYKLESYLQTNDVWALFDRLQKHGAECVQPTDPWAEFVLLRAGLFFMARTLPEEALPLLERASQAQEKREEFRTLYWLYYAYKSAGRPSDAATVRAKLYQKFPIGWHSILARVEDGTDPMKPLMDSPVYKDLTESGDAAADDRVSWLHLLMEREDATYAAKRYGEYVVRTLPEDAPAGLLQYLARAFDRRALYRLQIVTMNQISIKRPQLLTHESLRLLYPKPFFEELDSSSPHLDTAILLGLARQESSFDPGAKSKANAQGLLQILPSTARGIKKLQQHELYNYAQNIEVGSRFVLRLIDFFGGSVEKALASYNAGQGTIRKWEGRYDFVPDIQLFLDLAPFRETREYVPSILRNAYWYHRLFPELTAALSDNIMTSELLRVQLFPDLKKFNNPKPAVQE